MKATLAGNLKDETSRALFFHADHAAIWENEGLSVIESRFREITGDFHKDLSDEEIHMVAVMDIGARMSLFRETARHP